MIEVLRRLGRDQVQSSARPMGRSWRSDKLIGAFLILLSLTSFAYPQGGMMPGPGTVHSTGGGTCTPGTNATNYLARVSGYDQTHIDAFCVYINGLDTDGLFTIFDALYVYATDTSANALLNLISSSFNSTANGSPNFVADAGFTGVDGSTTVYINTNLSPSSGGVNFVQNSAHISAWSFTNAASGASGGTVVGYATGGAGSRLFPKYLDGNLYGDVNVSAFDTGITNSDSTGQYLINRSGATATQKYRNASSVGTSSTTSAAIPANTIIVLANGNVGTVSFGGAYQISVASAGGSLNSTQVTNFYNRTCTLLTTLHGSC